MRKCGLCGVGRMMEDDPCCDRCEKILGDVMALSVEEQLAASTEYLQKYGHLLPSELTEGSAARIRANLPKVLEEHPHLIQRLRQVGR